MDRRVQPLLRERKVRADAPEAQLYDLAADPAQKTNVIRENPEIAARLAATLERLRNSDRTATGR